MTVYTASVHTDLDSLEMRTSMISHTLLMSSLSFNFYKAANLFEILI
jgi:hypothetical protein